MKLARPFVCFLFVLFSLGNFAPAASSEAKVTVVIHDVKLLPNKEDARPAALNDRVAQDTGVRTGDQSRSELTFADLTITRLGANSIYNYNRAGRSVDLGGGSVLLRVPKDSGGASVRAPAVSVAVTGTTFILETQRGGRSKLMLLEGSARLSLRKYPKQVRDVKGGQMLDVPAGATTLPDPVPLNLNQLMKTHPLIVGFPPLPSQGAIMANANNPNEPVYQGTQVGGPGIGLGGFPIPIGVFGGGGGHPRGGNGGHTNGVGGNGGSGGKGGQTTTRGEKPPPRPKSTPKPPGIQ